MSLIYDILESILEPTMNYKGTRVNLLGLPKWESRSRGSVKATLSGAYRKGLVEKYEGAWRVTPKGKKYMHKKMDSLKYFSSLLKKDAPKNLIVMFDIPEAKKAEREWFRWHLKKFHYDMLQKSVWVGPSPLPKEFLDYAKKIGLKDAIRTLKLAKPIKM